MKEVEENTQIPAHLCKKKPRKKNQVGYLEGTNGRHSFNLWNYVISHAKIIKMNKDGEIKILRGIETETGELNHIQMSTWGQVAGDEEVAQVIW